MDPKQNTSRSSNICKRKQDERSDSDSHRDDVLTPGPSGASRSRSGLTREQALQIYGRRPGQMGFQKSRRGTMVGCEAVAVEFGVTPKTVRDIWRGRTWGEATGHPQSHETRSALQPSALPIRNVMGRYALSEIKRMKFAYHHR